MSTKKEETFTMIPSSLMSNKYLTDQDKLTLGIILSFVNNNKQCYVGNDKLGEMLGITKNAASKRILRLEKLGCIKLDYVLREGKKEVDKRYITLLSLTPEVSSDRPKVSSDGLHVSSVRREGIVPQTSGYSPTDFEVSSKQGGIIQGLLNNGLNNVSDNLPYKENTNIYAETSVEEILKKKSNLKKELINIFKNIPDIIKLVEVNNIDEIRKRTSNKLLDENLAMIEEYQMLKI